MAQPKRAAKKTVAKLAKTRVLIVEARFYDDIADALLEGAVKVLDEAGATYERITVPGALEIPAAIAIAVEGARRSRKAYDAAVALGCVIQGETYHFEIVSMQSAQALMDYAVAQQFPVGNGILTVDNNAQAWARARATEGDKGGDAARAALAMVAVKRDHGKA